MTVVCIYFSIKCSIPNHMHRTLLQCAKYEYIPYFPKAHSMFPYQFGMETQILTWQKRYGKFQLMLETLSVICYWMFKINFTSMRTCKVTCILQIAGNLVYTNKSGNLTFLFIYFKVFDWLFIWSLQTWVEQSGFESFILLKTKLNINMDYLGLSHLFLSVKRILYFVFHSWPSIHKTFLHLKV